MKIAILGGGFTGLSAAHYLSQQGHAITIFEKESVLGGLAVGIKGDGWDWYIERAYHHLFSTDTAILNFAREMGFNDIFFQSPITASLYQDAVNKNNYRIIPVDSPQEFLKFPLLSFPVKVRAALVLAFLKFGPFLRYYERMSAEEFLKRYMGEEAWNVLWEELFRKKFGKYAENIVASFIWARIKMRTKDLGYVAGGFQALLNHAEQYLLSAGVRIEKGVAVIDIEQKEKSFNLIKDTGTEKGREVYDVVISTLPTPVLTRVAQHILPERQRAGFQKIQFLHAMTLILETKEKLLDTAYWLSICTPDMPMMVTVQHTNFIDKKHYGGNNLIYVGNYIDREDPLLKMDAKETVQFFLPHLRKLNPTYGKNIINTYHFKAPFAQPIFDKAFLKVKPEFETSVKNFYIANLDMTYPYDRSTNCAVQLGKDVSEYV